MEFPSKPIGSHQQQADDLLATQKLLRATLDSSMDMIQVFEAVRNEQGEIVDFTWILNNHASEKIYGDVVGKSLLQLQPGVVEEGIFAAFKQVVETGVPQQYEKHYVHEQFDGWFHQSVVKLGDGVATTTADITPRKQAEQQLQQSQALLQSVIDSSLDIIQVFKAVRDETGAILDFVWVMNNQKAVAQNGQVIGKSLLKQNPGVVQTAIFDHMVEVAQTGVAYEHEQYYPHEQFDGWFYQALVQTDDGVAMTTRDISRQKQAEQEVLRLKDEIAQKATDKYRTLFNSIDEGFELVELIYDQAGKPIDFLYLETNPAFERQTGLNNVAGKLGKEVSPNIEAYWLEAFDQVVKTGEPIRVEDYNAFTQRWYSSYGFRVGNQNDRVFAVLFNDITERKQREQGQAFLLHFSDQLRLQVTPDAIATCALEGLIAHLRLDRSYIVSYDLADNSALLDYQIGNDTVPPLPQRFDLSNYLEASKAILDQTLVIDDDFERQGLSETEKQNSARLGMRAMVAATLRKGENNPLWSMVAINSKPRRWTPDEVQLVEEVAERTWTAIERAKAEQALSESEEKYRSLFESIDEAFVINQMIFDEEGKAVDFRVLEANRVYQRQTGLTDAVGKRQSEILPQIEPYWMEGYARVALTGEPWRTENYSADLGRWYQAYVSRIGGAGSNLIAVIFDDITERKHNEQRQGFLLRLSDALRVPESPEETGALAMRMVAKQLRLDRCWVCRFSKEQGLAWLGPEYCLPDLPRMSGEYFLRDFPETMRQVETSSPAIDDVRNDPGLSELDRTSILRLGMGAYMTTILRKGEQGYFWAICASTSGPRSWTQSDRQLLNDVTERVWAAIERAKTDEALRVSQQRFASVANLVPDLLWDSEPDGSTNWYNNRWLEYTGQTFEEAIGWGWTDAIHPDDRQASAKRYRQAVEESKPLRQEERIRRYDGVYRWFVVNVIPLQDEQNRVVKMYGAATDIHESKLLEATLREADRRKDEFLAMLAHELRNPMSTIRSGLQILSLVDTNDELSNHTVEMMNRQTDHLVRMVDDLLDVSRISRGKIELKTERVNLVEVVSHAAESVRSLYQEQGKFLQTDLPKTPIEMEGDATRLTQVVANLLTNGARYTGEQGQVWISLMQKEKEAIIQVRDNGIGLATDQLSSIFELFVQVDNSLARSKGGLGLGLTLVKRLAEMHGGRVEARSEGEGQGSTFTVHLPTLTTADEPTAGPAPQAPDPARAQRLLVIDDNADAAFTLAMLLKLKGYEAHTRTSGRAGIEAAEQLQPAAILLDIGMPQMDGYETCRLIRQQTWGNDMVVIALTGYGHEEDRQRTREAGFDGHLVKPVDLGVLTKLLLNLLDNGREPLG